jgi:undecaprenyl-diphosphatase
MELLLPAVILGAVQGFTEFLPVSSTAHLKLLPQIMGWNQPLLNSQAFDVAMHAGTLAALLWVYGRTWMDLAAAMLRPGSSAGRFGWGMAAATVPVLLAGLLLEHAVERRLGSPLWIAAWIVLGAVALAIADRRPSRGRQAASLSFRDALLIGLGQAVAVLPGFSRSGATITAGLLLGLTRAEAARYSFLLSVPAVAAACIWEARHLAGLGTGEWTAILAGVVTSAITGGLAIRWLLAAVSRMSYRPFVGYRLALAAGIALWALAR